MEHGVDAFVEKAKQLEVDEERQEEIYVEVEEAVEDRCWQGESVCAQC